MTERRPDADVDSGPTGVWDEVVGQPETVAILRTAAAAADRIVTAAAAGRIVTAAAAGRIVTAAAAGRIVEAAAGVVSAQHAADNTVSSAAAMTHSWLFTGPAGSGRSVAARAFAAALQCPFAGCGQCVQCHTVRAGTHADVHIVVPDGLSIPVKDMRELVRTAARRLLGRPLAGRHRRGCRPAHRGRRQRLAQSRRGAAGADCVPALRALDTSG
ncbi:MAG: hypothetical protein WKF47_03505 [Geodermatophilaceae bacterium]